jgi:hypothetical protein
LGSLKYGEEIPHGDTLFNVERLVALAGFHRGIRGDEVSRLGKYPLCI